MGRHKIYTAEEMKERKKASYLKYIKKRYAEDAEFREKKKANVLNRYKERKKKKLENDLHEYGQNQDADNEDKNDVQNVEQ